MATSRSSPEILTGAPQAAHPVRSKRRSSALFLFPHLFFSLLRYALPRSNLGNFMATSSAPDVRQMFFVTFSTTGIPSGTVVEQFTLLLCNWHNSPSAEPKNTAVFTAQDVPGRFLLTWRGQPITVSGLEDVMHKIAPFLDCEVPAISHATATAA